MAANPKLEHKDRKCCDLEERYKFLQEQLTNLWQMHKTAFKLKDDLVKSRCQTIELRKRLHTDQAFERIQVKILIAELVRKDQLLEECEAARRADQDLIERLQSCCEELRSQRSQAEE